MAQLSSVSKLSNSQQLASAVNWYEIQSVGMNSHKFVYIVSLSLSLCVYIECCNKSSFSTEAHLNWQTLKFRPVKPVAWSCWAKQQLFLVERMDEWMNDWMNEWMDGWMVDYSYQQNLAYKMLFEDIKRRMIYGKHELHVQ